MNTIQFIQYTPEQLQADITTGVASALENFFKDDEKKPDPEYLTRKEVASLLKINLSTLHNWCKQGKLKPYGIGNRVYFKREEIEESIISIS